MKAFEPAQPEPADVPLPPRRNAANDSAGKPQAALRTQSFAAKAEPKPAPGTLASVAPAQQ